MLLESLAKHPSISISVSCGSHFQVHFVWQVWAGQISPGFKSKRLNAFGRWKPGYGTAPCQDSKGKGCVEEETKHVHCRKLNKRNLRLSYQCAAQAQHCRERGWTFPRIFNRQQELSWTQSLMLSDFYRWVMGNIKLVWLCVSTPLRCCHLSIPSIGIPPWTFHWACPELVWLHLSSWISSSHTAPSCQPSPGIFLWFPGSAPRYLHERQL